MGHLLAIRSNRTFFRSGLHANWRLWAAVLLVFALQSVITYVPAAQRVFHTEALSFAEFLLIAMLSAIVFAAVEIEKALFNRKQARGKRK